MIFVLSLSAFATTKTKSSNLLGSGANRKLNFNFSNKIDSTKKEITGKVVDENNQPLPGVSVKVKGTNIGAVTDAGGNFKLDPGSNTILVFTFISYAQQEVNIAGKTTVSVKLLPDTKNLKEVVVTALGIQKEARKVGYAVTTVKSDQLSVARETNIAASLQGQAAGVSVSGSNGGPGSSARISLRGLTSFSAGSPLYVINGIPMDNTQRGSAGEFGGSDNGDGIGNINPDDVESMTILKGQSASALYGSRAANGVILITTKSGKNNSPFGVEFNTNFQFDQPVDNTDFQQIYGQGIQGVKPTSVGQSIASGNLAWGPIMDGSTSIGVDGSTQTYSKAPDNYLSFYRTAPSYTNTVVFTGGNDKGSFRLSASNLRANSMVPNSYIDRKTFNFSGNQNVTKDLQVTVNANYVLEKGKNRSNVSDGPGNPNNVQFLAPNQDQRILAPGTRPDGKELTFTDDTFVTNPYFAAYNFINDTDRKRLISSISAKYNILSWVYVQGRLGYDVINDELTRIEPTGTGYLNNNGNMRQANSQITEFNADVLINGKHDIVKDVLNLDLSLGGNIRKNNTTGTFISGNDGFIIPNFYSLSNFKSRSSGYIDEFAKRQVNSAYYSADFSYKNFLVLSTTGRYDYYSSIAKSVGPGIFTPSVSGSFIFSELFPVKGMDLGKLRLSYAQTSGDANPYANKVYYDIANAINGIPALSINSQLPNLFLKPFTLREFEAGLEMKFLENRIGFDIAYFARKTKDEIITADLDYSSGYTSRFLGTGSTQNRGIEIEVHGTPVKNEEFSWTPSLNFTYVKNKILKTDNNNANVSLGGYRPQNANLALVVGLPGPQIMANDYVRDANGKIVVDDSGLPLKGALMPMGSTTPKFFGGFNNTITYKKFNLGLLFDYRFGVKVLSATEYYSIFRGLNKMTLDGRETGVVADAVTQTGAPNTVNVPAQTYYQAVARNISALDVLDGSFVKLRQFTLGYTFNGDMLKGTPFNSITVSAVGRNLLTLYKKTKNIDPESQFSNLTRFAGVEGTSLPFARTYGFTLNFKFKN